MIVLLITKYLYSLLKVKSMVNLVDDIAANALKSMVAGEELDTAAPLGHPPPL